MPIPLGVLAVAGAGAGPAPTPPGVYDWLETVIVGSGGQSSVTFSNLNTNYGSLYKHLQIRMAVRTNNSSTSDYLEMQLNGDTGGNYAAHDLSGDGSAVASNGFPNLSFMGVQRAAGGNASADVFGSGITDILDAFNTNKNTTIRSFGGVGGTNIWLTSGHWRNTAAITSIRLDPGTGTTFVENSRFSLYGLRSANV